MRTFLAVIHIIVAILMMLVVLVQQRKQGGFAGIFGGGTQPDAGQWQRFTPLTKITIVLAAIFMITSFLIVYIN